MRAGIFTVPRRDASRSFFVSVHGLTGRDTGSPTQKDLQSGTELAHEMRAVLALPLSINGQAT